MKRINIQEVTEFIEKQGPNTKIYFGGDSERFKRNGIWYAEYYTVIVIHIDGKHGCKVFGEIVSERDYDTKKNKPRMRLMNEVIKIAELYLKFSDLLEDKNVEIHLDISKDEKNGSSVVINEAIGYIKGMCNVVPIVKPNAWCASTVADRFKNIANVA
jgi:predicted RNase H-related nuclease YkuK (DUF458 family)